jgi:hypothetical protein
MFSRVTWMKSETKNQILGITSTPNNHVNFGLNVPPTAGADIYILSTATFVPTPSPYPTYTPLPTYTALANFPLSNHRFSFYDPMIGRDKPDIALINCENWNFETQYCDSKLRNGERWEDNYFISAACPYDLYLAGAHFQVISPDWLKLLFPQGFTCKDTGEAVTGLFIDFLIPHNQMPMAYDLTPWGTPITLMRTR